MLSTILLIITALGVAVSVSGETISYRLAHPVGWMHLLPVGEAPGWSQSRWFNLEVAQANIWGIPFEMTDKRNGNVYFYQADYEQTSAIANFGWALGSQVAVAFEVPYANHNGGFLDDFIDQFHVLIQSDRFQRQMHPKFSNKLVIKKNGVDQLSSSHAEGVGSLKTKLKIWFWQIKSATPGACDCGAAASFHVKAPTQKAERGLSSGGIDYTGMLNIGFPLFEASGFWFTTAVTYLDGNKVFRDWPMRRWLQMYEASLTFGITQSWSFVLQGRYESPLFSKEHVEFTYNYDQPRNRDLERSNSGWNSLMYWRGSESFGFKYRWSDGDYANFLFVEDWGRGKYDSSGAVTYINNAPDVQFLTQWHFGF